MDSVEILIEKLRDELPPIWARSETDCLTGGVIKARTLANLMSAGKGPSGTFRIGRRRVALERDSFLDWLSSQLRPNSRKNILDLTAIRAKKRS